MPEWVVYIIAGVLMLVVVLGIHKSKTGWMIAGYNTMPKQQKAKTNLRQLKRLMCVMLIADTAVFLLTGIVLATNVVSTTVAASVCWPVFLVITLGGVIYANIGKRFRA